MYKFLPTKLSATRVILIGSIFLFLVIILICLMYVVPRRKSVFISQNSRAVSPTNTKTYIEVSYDPVPVEVDSIFSQDHIWTATLSAERLTTVIATGDVLPARSVNFKATQKNNFLWPYEKTAELLQSGDITIINLETPFIANCPLINSGMIFCGDVRNIEGLKYAGIDAANLANNHMGNWGQDGVNSTVSLLEKNNIISFGHVNPVYINAKKGAQGFLNEGIQGVLRVALLGYNDVGRQVGVIHVDDETFEEDIKKAAQNADLVIVSFHWGVEYTHQPTNRQLEIAHRAVDAGADLIIGNHPHWIQPPEIYNEKLIVYAHGNFIFDQMWSRETRDGIVGRYMFYDDQLIDAEFIPIIIEDYGQPRMADDTEKKKLFSMLKKISL